MSRRKQARPSRATLDDELLCQGALRIDPRLTAGLVAAAAAAATAGLANLRAATRDENRDDNESGSDGEESAGVGEAAVDLTSTRSQHEEDMYPDEPMTNDVADDDELDDAEEAEDGAAEVAPEVETQTPTRLKKTRELPDAGDDDVEGSSKRMRLCQDAENNNSFVEGESQPASIFPPAGTSHVTLEALQNTKVAVAQFAATALAGGADSEDALRELAVLQNTLFTLQHQQVFQLQLISQLQQQLQVNVPPTTTAGTTNNSNATESTSTVTTAAENSKETSPSPALPLIHPKPLSSLTSPTPSRPPSQQPQQPSSPVVPTEKQNSSASVSPQPAPTSVACTMPPKSSPQNNSTPQPTPSHQVPALCSISSSLASSIITNNDPPPLNEPNTLEMLQKRAQEVLENASQGLLANNLADELAFRGSKSRLSPYDGKGGNGRSEPFFKHRCRYCGKVFGSDSALQIHIRSHTGERPFKCNVCGSRFTTKGNLKVHFQRHRDKFPHVKMNPNPVPEHLDKYHPPLLQQLAACGQRPLNSPPPPPIPPHPGSMGPQMHPAGPPPFHSAFLPPQPPLPLGILSGALYRPPLLNSIQPPTADQEVPENLSKPMSNASHSPSQSPEAHSNSHQSLNEKHSQQQPKELVKSEQERSPCRDYQPPQRPVSRENDRITPKNEPEDVDENNEDDEFDTPRRYSNCSPINQTGNSNAFEDCSMDSKVSAGQGLEQDMDNDEDMDDEPENLSSRANPASMLQQSMVYPGASPASSSGSSGSIQTSFANILFPGLPPHPQLAPHHPSAASQNSTPAPPPGGPENLMDPARDPAIYSSLLPRPGSNDNSWESLIEITKTSETSKLQQLVDNIEHKLTDPNQCIICQRVLSCKSALQMHYRTHTGERPFKCKICGRAFTTKGNLKTHMGVHRAKPPLRMLHQCTVCHKKFSNTFVLQQHVNLHTNEPTELTPEQIRAAEVHDFAPVGYPAHPLAAFLPQGFPPIHPAHAGFPLAFAPHHPHGLDRPGIDSEDRDSKESLQHQQQLHQLQKQHQMFLEEQAAAAAGLGSDDEVDDEEDDRRNDDDERCDRRSSDGEEKETDKDHLHHESENRINSSPMPMPRICKSSPQRYNGSENSNSPPNIPVTSSAPLDLTPRASSTPASGSSTPISPQHPAFGMFAGILQTISTAPVGQPNAVSPGPAGIGPLASLTTRAAAATSSYNPLGLAVGGAAVRGNTTCNICYKTFACNSALEIHYRSHTKERPFKCSICDRGFSTKTEVDPTTGKRVVVQDKCRCAERARRSAREKARRRRKAEERQRQGRTAIANGDNIKSNMLMMGVGGGRPTHATQLYGDLVSLPPIHHPLETSPSSSSALGMLASDTVFLGNMKQHMLTHKIRDMPHHLFSDSKSQPSQSQSQSQQQQQQPIPPSSAPPQQPTIPVPPPPPPPSQPQSQQSQNLNQHQQLLPPMHEPTNLHLQREQSRSPVSADEANLSSVQPPVSLSQQSPEALSITVKKNIMADDIAASKKQQPSILSKHLCQVCNKNFSSSSALQIHMRTHTGDKPFQCTICQKAFTTKGNLKVHMGTHMWTNGASRRGRRMSLDIPSLPITPKDSEFLQRRPDLFYPYLPAPFLNGVPQKLNEMPALPTNASGGNGLGLPVNHTKYAGLFGSVYAAAGFPPTNELALKSQLPQLPHPLSNGPDGLGHKTLLFQSRPVSPPSPSQSPSWNTGMDLQQQRIIPYEREPNVPRPDSPGSPPRLPPTATREGLAA